MIHVCVALVTAYGNVEPHQWWLGNILDSFSRWAVPVFVMISGAVLLDSSKPTSEVSHQEISQFYAKRLLRLALPLTLWTVFYAWYYHVFRGDPLTIEFALRRILFDQPYEHLYFIWLLLELALITPWLRALTSQTSQTTLGFLSLLFLGIMLFWIPRRLLFPFFIPYLGYYCIGLFVKRLKLTKGKTLTAAVFFLGSCGLIAYGTALAFRGQLRLSHPLALYEYAHPLVAISSIAVFLLIRTICEDSWVAKLLARRQKLIAFFSSLTFGVYLVHVAVLEVLISGGGVDLKVLQPTALWLFLLFIATVVLSALLSYGFNLLGMGVAFLFRTKREFNKFPG